MVIKTPIVKWAEMADDSPNRHKVMQEAWRCASARIADSDNPWEHICGPAGALIATCEQIGWHVPQWNKVETDDGRAYDLTTVRPSLVVDKAGESVERMLWHQSNHADHDNTTSERNWTEDMPWWSPSERSLMARTGRLQGQPGPWWLVPSGHRPDCTAQASRTQTIESAKLAMRDALARWCTGTVTALHIGTYATTN